MKTRLKWWFYGRCPGVAGSFPYFGTRVHFPKGSAAFATACVQSVYEYDNVRALLGLVRPGTWCLDVGANIGLMSVPVLKAVEGCKVASFEASPNSLPYLEKTISGSAYAGRWILVSRAVGASDGRTSFDLSAPEHGAFDGIRHARRVPATSTIEVEMTTLDRWWNEADRPVVSAIKCDVEGAELQVLHGARACLAGCRPHVLLEWNRLNLAAYGCHFAALLGFAEEEGYSLYAVPHFVPVDSASGLELQMAVTESFVLAPKRAGG